MGTKVYIYTLNRHPSTADTHDIMDNSESPDCHPFTLVLKQPLNSGHPATPYNGQQIHSTARFSYYIQWNPSITADTIGTNILSIIVGVPNLGASSIFPVGMVCLIWLLSCIFRP